MMAGGPAIRRVGKAMTEEEWLTGNDPTPMLEFLRGKVSDRKLRLFGCACCRGVSNHFEDQRYWQLLDVAEQFTDSAVTDSERSEARKVSVVAAEGRDVTSSPSKPKYQRRQASALYWSLARESFDAALNTPKLIVEAFIWQAGGHAACDWAKIRLTQFLVQTKLLRDIFGNPFRPVVADPAWLTPTVVSIADALYRDRAFDRLPILADALAEAGCTDADLLLHCRQPGEHVRGCWAVDLVLGRRRTGILPVPDRGQARCLSYREAHRRFISNRRRLREIGRKSMRCLADTDHPGCDSDHFLAFGRFSKGGVESD